MSKHRGLGELTTVGLILLMALLVLIGYTQFYTSFFNNYGVTGFSNATEITNSSSVITRLNQTTGNIGTSIQSSTGTEENVFLVIFNQGFESVKNLFDLIGIGVDMVSGVGAFLSDSFGMDISWAIVILVGAIALFVTMVILKVTLGRDV